MATKDEIRRAAIKTLIEQGEPDRCHRCHGGPGAPGCGKTIHLILDQAFMDAAQAAGLPEEEAVKMLQEDDD